MSKKLFNVNSEVYIQITEAGWSHLKKTVGQEYIDVCIKIHEVVLNDEIWYKMQFHHIMNILPIGSSFNVLYKTNILFDEEDLKEISLR